MAALKKPALVCVVLLGARCTWVPRITICFGRPLALIVCLQFLPCSWFVTSSMLIHFLCQLRTVPVMFAFSSVKCFQNYRWQEELLLILSLGSTNTALPWGQTCATVQQKLPPSFSAFTFSAFYCYPQPAVSVLCSYDHVGLQSKRKIRPHSLLGRRHWPEWQRRILQEQFE